jgi:hypothetical protein
MFFPKALCFVLGVLVGSVGLLLWFPLDIAPPMPQETIVRDLTFSKLKNEDTWLLDSQPRLVPLYGIKSGRKYAILIFVPSAKGVTTSPSHTTWLWLRYKDYIQPIEISSSDFGPKGDEVVVKFIDEGVTFQQAYSSPSLPILTSKDIP